MRQYYTTDINFLRLALFIFWLTAPAPFSAVLGAEQFLFPSFYDNATRKMYIVVTPSRYEQRLYDTNVPAAVIERTRIDEQAPRSMGELLSSAPGVFAAENLGRARLWGTETFFTIMLHSRFSTTTQFCYTQGKDMTHRWPLQAVPPARLTQSLRWDGRYPAHYSLPFWCELSCTYRFRQNRIARDWDKARMKTPGVAIWDLHTGGEVPSLLYSKKTECFFAATNITNKRYTEIPLYNGYELLKLPGRGVTMGIKLFF